MNTSITLAHLSRLCIAAAKRAGASNAVARSLAKATVAAEAAGQKTVGLSHFFDYLDSFQARRIDPIAVPVLTRMKQSVFHCDAKGGLAQLGFDMAFSALVRAARKNGLALFSQSNAFTCGSLGYHTERLAEQGLVALAATNGPAMITGAGAVKPIYCTNPLAFSAPVDGGPPLLIDQSSSACAFVNIREAAKKGHSIPEGWAIDREGNPTTDPVAAMEGALLTFGGVRGANIALMVEVLAAGISGANWSLDAASVLEGDKNCGTGLFIVAIDPQVLALDFSIRLAGQLHRLAHEFGVHIPGRAKALATALSTKNGIVIDRQQMERLQPSAKAR